MYVLNNNKDKMELQNELVCLFFWILGTIWKIEVMCSSKVLKTISGMAAFGGNVFNNFLNFLCN
jgi:hypothetical protein